LPTNEFSYNAAFKSSDGMLYFGSYNGLVVFRPQAISINKVAPKIVFSDLRLFNKPVEVGDKAGLLSKDISFTKEITFKADQNIFTVDFVALNYIKPERNKYAYKLDGFEENWNEVAIPSATYTNLPAGTYHLLVKGSNNDGFWNNTPTKLTIKILPPLWQTWWAYTLYLIAFGFILYYVNRFLRRQERLETELYYEHINNERQQELYQNKLDFFTRISHEIRTPLTLIFAPLEKLIQLTVGSPSLNMQLQSIKGNTDRLLRLISELLDFRKIETGNLQLQVVETEIISFCEHIYNAYKSQATLNQITFNFEHEEQALFAFVDQSQLEKVLFNLLSNAFKYTQEKGSITLKVVNQDKTIEISLIDNGIGIPHEHQDNIFTNFYQVKDKSHSPTGWGIGLALAKNIIDQHKGFITLISEPKTEEREGYTEFKVALLKGSAHFSSKEIATVNGLKQTNSLALNSLPEMEVSLDIVNEEEDSENQQTILVVEDNDELREFIMQSLQTKYTVVGRTNGAEGLEYAVENIPDIIISDVTMPIMDGFEFCAKIKQEERTNHIPVIMLTAMASHVHQVDGLEAGADLYITKPFSLQILELSIKNILSAKEALKTKFSRQVMLMPRSIEIQSPEENFLNKLMEIVEERLENPDFNVAVLVNEIGMSQTVLYKKIKALTDLSINDFIKSIRLKRAAQLLQERKMNVSEVAYSVGFNDRKYFSKEFKKQFGKAPSDYVADASS
jgi:signal transduction histidine kinase/DNA-binding response OmpR family regulator